jgi:hypothetical protein
LRLIQDWTSKGWHSKTLNGVPVRSLIAALWRGTLEPFEVESAGRIFSQCHPSEAINID